MQKFGKLSLNYPFNPFLSGTLSNLSVVLLTTCATEFCPVSGKELCEISVLDHTLSIKPVQSKVDRDYSIFNFQIGETFPERVGNQVNKRVRMHVFFFFF